MDPRGGRLVIMSRGCCKYVGIGMSVCLSVNMIIRLELETQLLYISRMTLENINTKWCYSGLHKDARVMLHLVAG